MSPEAAMAVPEGTHMNKLIVFYGINNLGKSTQAKLLVEKLKMSGKDAIHIKYPYYSIKPSGVLLNQYLREGNPQKLTPREAQILFAYNRSQFEPKLKIILENNIVVAEDYWGTGVAWGMGAGVDLDFLLELNSSFHREDAAFLFEGERFASGIEQNHKHETNSELTKKVETTHAMLADRFGWKRINANQSIEKVQQAIWQEVNKILQ